MELQEFKDNIRKTYRNLFTEIYAGQTIWPAKILVLIDEFEFDSGYCDGCNTIFISQGSANISDSDDLTIWPSWKKELVHEMIHEYQHKIEFDSSIEGKQLFDLFQESSTKAKSSANGSGFIGRGHDERFYTAIIKIAGIMKLTPIELKKRI